MPRAAFSGLPHSESEVYFVKSTTIGEEAVTAWELGRADVVLSLVCCDGGQMFLFGSGGGRQIRGNVVHGRFARDKEADNLLVCKAPLTLSPPISSDIPSSES